MHERSLLFDPADFNQELPAPGFYCSRIARARFKKSDSGNDTIQVVYELDGAPCGRDRVAESFLMRGGSERGRALSRQRLVGLYLACGLTPEPGGEIDPADLLGACVEVKVEHDNWQGRPCLRVVGHRPIDVQSRSVEVPF